MRILLLAGEPSGDRLGASVARALRALSPGVEIAAMGGAELRAAGVPLVVDSTALSVVGLTEVVGHLPELLRARSALRQEIADRPPDVLVPIDFPDFNIRIAAWARARAIPVAWLVGPQVWAWRPERIPSFARAVSRMLVLFPFEVETWRRAGVAVEHVGHPMADLPEIPRDVARDALSVGRDGGAVVALLPGSRRKEVRHIWPIFAMAAHQLAQQRPDLSFLVPLAPGISPADLESPPPARTRFIAGRAAEVVAACDVAAVASGTATLETAIAGRPLVVGYRVGRITMILSRLAADPAFLARGLLALPNLVLGRPVVPELYQERFTPDAIAAELARLLDDEDGARLRLTRELTYLRQAIGGPGASERIARAILATA
jgi:lipid-A-disaccharide synthase